MYDKSELAFEVLCEIQNTNKSFADVCVDDVLVYIVYAESDIALYLNAPLPLGDKLIPKIKELAKLKLEGEYVTSSQLKSRSYQEGEITESETYLTADDVKNRENALLSSLDSYRRCRIVT